METLLKVENLSVSFEPELFVVKNVSFEVGRGEVLALVGESGSGKSMSSLSIMGLLPRFAKMSGNIIVDDVEVQKLSNTEMQDVRGKHIGMIFQEPMTSLNPVLRIDRQMTEGLLRHVRGMSQESAKQRAISALSDVGIPDPERVMHLYPHHLSGGMRQRVMIAAAMTLEPGLLIADEPTTALDVTVQAQVLDLLVDLKNRMGSGILLITHDIGVVAETADRVAVMRLGEIIESGSVEQILSSPQHDYTKELVSSHLSIDRAMELRHARELELAGQA